MSSAGNPFEGMPFFGDLMKMLGAQGPVQWDGARQLALSIATDGGAEQNVDPLERITFEQLSRVAELQIGNATGLETSSSGTLSVVPVNRSTWVLATLEAYRPLIEALASSLSSDDAASSTDPALFDPSGGDPEEFLGRILGFLTPMLLGMTAGSLVGHLATRSFGDHDLTVPRPRGDEISVIAPNVAAFGDEWSMEPADLRLWVCLHQVAHHTVLRIPHVHQHLRGLLEDFVGAFESDPDSFGSALTELETDPGGGDPMARFQEMMGNPEFVLGAVRSDRQEELLPRIRTLVAVVDGYVDHIMDRVGSGLVGSYRQITEAMRRRRVEASQADRFIERLFGLELTREHFERGRAFVDGVVARAGDDGLARLWSDESHLPTPNELDAPGLWLARIGVDTFDEELEIDLSGLDELLGGPDDSAGDETPDQDGGQPDA